MSILTKGEIKVGDVVKCDSGFTCIPANALRTVQQTEDGDLWIKCEAGMHFVDGQLNEKNEYVGLLRGEI